MSIRNVYLDCEFIPADPTLKGLISIGLTDDNGRDYYAVHQGLDLKTLKRSDWLMANVWPSLPQPHGDARRHNLWPGLDTGHPDVKSAAQIADDIAEYFDTTHDTTHLWAWYGAQDMCRLHSLWDNDWAAMPAQVPRWFNELETLRWQVGGPDMPEQESGVHNALADARHNGVMRRFLAAYPAV
jgi:hypothetical protein